MCVHNNKKTNSTNNDIYEVYDIHISLSRYRRTNSLAIWRKSNQNIIIITTLLPSTECSHFMFSSVECFSSSFSIFFSASSSYLFFLSTLVHNWTGCATPKSQFVYFNFRLCFNLLAFHFPQANLIQTLLLFSSKFLFGLTIHLSLFFNRKRQNLVFYMKRRQKKHRVIELN